MGASVEKGHKMLHWDEQEQRYDPLIDAEKVYDNGTHALKGVSFTVDDGEFAFLVGPSGSGKSTIIKLLTGEVVPTAGRVMVNGFSMSRISERQIPYMRRTIGVIFRISA